MIAALACLLLLGAPLRADEGVPVETPVQRAVSAYARKDYAEAYRIVADIVREEKNSSPEAENLMGILLSRGLGGAPKDPLRAMEHFRESARGGLPVGQFNYAIRMLLSGSKSDDKQKIDEAIKWMNASAKAGFPASQYYLSKSVLDTRSDEAVGLLRAAASPGDEEESYLAGFPAAQVELAILYLEGDAPSLPRNTTKGILWLERAAELGDSRAMLVLGQIHETGKFGETEIEEIRPDFEEAAAWYLLSSRSKDKHGGLARGRLGKLAEQWEQPQRRRVADRARGIIRKHSGAD